MKTAFTRKWYGILMMLLSGLFPLLPVQAQTFQIGKVSDAQSPYLTFPTVVPCDLAAIYPGLDNDCPPPGAPDPAIEGSMTAEFTNMVVIPGGGVIGGDLLEFDVTITNTSPPGSDIVLTAFAFQSKHSESPALASRIGDKLFYGQLIGGAVDGQMFSVKKNGTSNGLFSGKWKGICINSSKDFLEEYNSGLANESLECAGNRVDSDGDGVPEVVTDFNQMLGLRPGESQTVRLRLDAGVTDGALHAVEAGTLTGTVQGIPITGPNGIDYFDVAIDAPGTVLDVIEYGDNKVMKDVNGNFNPTFAPKSDGFSFEGQQYLTLPRPNFAFSDLLGRNHSCATYGLDDLTGIPCSANPTGQPVINLLSTGDLIPGIQNFAAILQGFGEFYDPDNDFVPDVNTIDGETPTDTRPSQPYDVLCENCAGRPYVPIAEFYIDNGDGTVTRQMTAGSYGTLGTADQYTATVNTTDAEKILEEVIPEIDPGGPQPGAQLESSAVGVFRDLEVIEGEGINGGDAIMFTIDITNTSGCPPGWEPGIDDPADCKSGNPFLDSYLTAFNYQTKERGLADIGILDGTTQDRRDIRLDNSLTPCLSLDDAACWNATLGIGHFPNVIGNGLLFGQMVWTDADAGREPDPVDPGQVHVAPTPCPTDGTPHEDCGIDPVTYWLESVKKNGPFSPILRGNENFICVKSGLFDLDPDADAACAGDPAILIDEDGYLVPGNISQRLGLPPGETQSVRIRMEFGDFRGALLKLAQNVLNTSNVQMQYVGTDGLARSFDASDQRELEYAHPNLVGQTIGYLPNTIGNPDAATWLTPTTLEEIEYVILNQPGDAPTVMNFQDNFGFILAMAGFRPSAEFYAPDPNPNLVGTPFEGALIQQQVLGEYELTDVNEPPVAAFTDNCVGLDCDFDASTSTDPDGSIVSYSWDFGDGSPAASGVTPPTHTYATGGFYNVTLTVEDDEGATNSVTQTIGVFDPAVNVPPMASFTVSDKALDIALDASASADVDGTIVSYDWDFGDGNTGSGVTTSHTYLAPGTYTVELTVTDDDSDTDVLTQDVTVSWDGNIVSNNSNSAVNGAQTIGWTSSFSNNNYVVGDFVVVRVEWNVDCGATSFNPDGHPVGIVPRGSEFSPEGVTGTSPVLLASGNDWAVFCFQYTAMGVKGNAQFNVLVGIDEDCDSTVDGSAMLGINVHVRTDGGEGI